MPPHRHVALIIEDHPDVREAFRILIDSNGFDVVAAHSGAEALAWLRSGLPCCLIVLDWQLPDMNGEQFRQDQLADPHLASVPIAISTGDPRIKARAAALGIQHIFVKPIDVGDFLALLADHCPQRP